VSIEVQRNEAAESKYITIINENVSGDPVPIDLLAFDCAIEAEKNSCAFAESSKGYSLIRAHEERLLKSLDQSRM
jgi:hypothetical protein